MCTPLGAIGHDGRKTSAAAAVRRAPRWGNATMPRVQPKPEIRPAPCPRRSSEPSRQSKGGVLAAHSSLAPHSWLPDAGAAATEAKDVPVTAARRRALVRDRLILAAKPERNLASRAAAFRAAEPRRSPTAWNGGRDSRP